MSDTLEETLPAHAPLGPSSSEGWSTCADYVNANRGLPDLTTEPAAEGTAAHAISDLCLLTGLDPYDFVGIKSEVSGFTFVWDDEDAMLLQLGIEAVRDAGGQFFGEFRVDISRWTLPGQFGTLDRAIIVQIDGEWWVVLIDLKWGRGVPVSPVENKQLMLYALGFWDQIARHIVPGAVRFKIIIDQPRHGGGGGVWNTTLDRLLKFGAWIKERAAETALSNATRTASRNGCIWCRRRRVPGGCDTFDRYMIGLLDLDWDAIDRGILMTSNFAPPRELTADRRAWLLLHKDSIRRWLDQLDEEAMADAKAGADIGMLKLVEGNKLPDKWRDKGADAIPVVEKLIGADGFNKRLKTPKQIGKVVEGNEEAVEAIEPFIERGRKKPILVPLEDAREPIRSAADFEELPEEGTD